MLCYGAKELEASFRTVRNNTMTIAEEIPAEKYDFRATPAVRSVGEMLVHIAAATRFSLGVHSRRIELVDFATFGKYMQEAQEDEQELSRRSKEEIIAALKARGEEYATFLGSLSDELLASRVAFPPPIQPPSKCRLEMVLGTKEHEMHHRAQLMLVQRLLGIVPHLTRRREEMAAARR